MYRSQKRELTTEARDVRKNPRRLTVVVYIRSIVKRGARAEL